MKLTRVKRKEELVSISKSFRLVEFPPQVAANCHYHDHACIYDRKEQALGQLLIHNVVKNIVNISEVNCLLDVRKFHFSVRFLYKLALVLVHH